MSHNRGDCAGYSTVHTDAMCRECWVTRNPDTFYGPGDPPPAVIWNPGNHAGINGITVASRARAQPRPVPCIHLGPALAQQPQNCGCTEKIRECALHETCTTLIPSAKAKACCAPGVCQDYDPKWPDTEGRPGPKSPPATVAEVLRGPPGALDQTWEHWPNIAEAHRILLREVVSRPYQPLHGQGRGIVYCAGGTLYASLAYVSLRLLRSHGCTLPAEVWHLGRHEFDPTMERLFEPLGVTIRDASKVAHKPRILNGWELKPFALLHSHFAECLMLDADNFCIDNPADLFEAEEYRRTGACFWPDLPPSDQGRTEWVPKVVWDSLGIAQPLGVRALESGQVMVDRTRCGRELEICMAINEHSDWWYRMVFGDKDTFLLAWHYCGTPYAITGTPAGWVWPAIYQHDHTGRLRFQHCACGKGEVVSGNAGGCFVHRERMNGFVADLRKLWHGEIWSWRDMSPDETAQAERLCGVWHYERLGLSPPRDLELLSGGKIGKGSAACEVRWCLRMLDDRPTLVITGGAHKGTHIGMMFLTMGDDGVWRGQWSAHERGPVELRCAEPIGEKVWAMRGFLRSMPPAPVLAGTAVVTLTSRDYWPGTYILLKMLQRVGCTLPVQVWHRGDPPPALIADLPGVTLHDLTGCMDGYRQYHNTDAIMASGLRHVLYIDSDAYPAVDPTPLLADGNATWQDAHPGDPFRPELYGLAETDTAETFTPQGGVKVLDMATAWPSLALANYLCRDEAFYFAGQLGEQAQFRAAWRLLGETPKCYGRVEIIDPYILIHAIDGQPVFIHRPGAKFAEAGTFEHPPQRFDELPYEADVWQLYADYLGSR